MTIARLAPANRRTDGRGRWTVAASLIVHGVILLLLLLNVSRQPGPGGEAAPSYQLMFEGGNTPPAASPQSPAPEPAPAPESPPTKPPPGPDALQGPQSTPAPSAPPVAKPAPRTPPPAQAAPTPAPAPADVTPAPPAPAPPPAQTPSGPPRQAELPVSPEVPEPQAAAPQASAPPEVRLAEPADTPPAPPPPEFAMPKPPEPLPPLEPTPPSPSTPRPQTTPNPSTAGTFAKPLDLDFGNAARRLAAPRMAARPGSAASRSLDLSLGAPKGGLNRQQEFFDARAANVTADWGASLHAYWLRHRFYPRQAAENGEDGAVDIELTVNRNGQVENVSIKSRSGSQWLDMAAVAVWRSAKLPPLPDETKGRTITFPLHIYYQLIR